MDSAKTWLFPRDYTYNLPPLHICIPCVNILALAWDFEAPLRSHWKQNASIPHHNSYCNLFRDTLQILLEHNYLALKLFPDKLGCKHVRIENNNSLHRRGLWSPRLSPDLKCPWINNLKSKFTFPSHAECSLLQGRNFKFAFYLCLLIRLRWPKCLPLYTMSFLAFGFHLCKKSAIWSSYGWLEVGTQTHRPQRF